MSRLRAPRGTFDVLPEDAVVRRRVEATARAVLEGAGYARVETPTFEATELFARGVGASTDVVQKEMFSFADTEGVSFSLRPEGTAPVCRAYVEHGMHKRPQPVRLWYHGAFFRHERPQAGRFRQFHQVGAEAIGSDDPALDAEVVVLLHDLLDRLGVRGVRLRLGSLGRPETRASYRVELASFLRAHEARLAPEVVARIDLNPLRAFDAADPGTREVMREAPRLMDRLDVEDREHFAAVRGMLDAAGVPYELDPTLVRGLDYYTRTVFEFTSDALGAQSGVGGGGRYDGLVEQLGGPPTPGVGWAAGVERMLLAAADAPAVPPGTDLYVAIAKPERRAEAFRLAVEARRAGLGAELEAAGRGLKGQLKQANRAGARFVAILGDEEGAAVKDLASGEQREVPLEEVVRVVGEGRP